MQVLNTSCRHMSSQLQSATFLKQMRIFLEEVFFIFIRFIDLPQCCSLLLPLLSSSLPLVFCPAYHCCFGHVSVLLVDYIWL